MSDAILPTVIIGAGPAGVSAAWALHARGMPITLLDAGVAQPKFPPAGDYLGLRFSDREQWRWQLGERFGSFDAPAQASPKLRVPGLQPIFDGYARANRMRPEPGFQLVGALAAGGLSNAWGCGVASFDAAELGPLHAERDAMRESYARVALRMGLSGAEADPLRAYFGLDEWAQPALPLDLLHRRLWRNRARLGADDLMLGRARVAVLNEDREGRGRCDLSGTCLWGCGRGATWSAAPEVAALRHQSGVEYVPDTCVDRLRRADDGTWIIEARTASGIRHSFHARRVVLAAGTLASTRLVLAALPDPPREVRLLSNPMAAFLLLLPAMLGSPRERAFGLAQLSFVLARVHGEEPAMGNLFSTMGLPVSEFLTHLPVTRRAGLPLLRMLLSATVVGNVFLPGSLSAHAVGLDTDGGLRIRGGASDELPPALAAVRSRIGHGFRKVGGRMLPGSFVAGAAGADLHYAATLPIRARPAAHECRLDGEVAALPGIYVVDGAALPGLPAKAHTLTIMANADRVARALPME